MNRWTKFLTRFLMAVAVAGFGVVLGVAGFWYWFHTGGFGNRLGARIDHSMERSIKDRAVFDMKRAATFGWDRFFLFDGYADSNTIDAALGFRSGEGPPDQDGECLVVFVVDHRVVGSGVIYFSCADAGPFQRSEAVFDVKVNEAGGLELKPAGGGAKRG